MTEPVGYVTAHTQAVFGGYFLLDAIGLVTTSTGPEIVPPQLNVEYCNTKSTMPPGFWVACKRIIWGQKTIYILWYIICLTVNCQLSMKLYSFCRDERFWNNPLVLMKYPSSRFTYCNCLSLDWCHLHQKPQVTTQFPPKVAIWAFLPEYILFVNADLLMYITSTTDYLRELFAKNGGNKMACQCTGQRYNA
jgi:hypothetical protein